MATDIVSKRWNLPLRANGRRYSDPSAVPDLDPPTNVVAEVSGTTITVTFTDNTGGTAQHVAYRSTDGGVTYLQHSTLSAADTSLEDAGLSNGTYYYKFKARVGSDDGVFSEADSETVSAATGARTITSAANGGVNFGGGPTVVLFDRMEGTDNTTFNLSGPAIGTWDRVQTNAGGVAASFVKYFADNGRSWLSGRDRDAIAGTSTRVCAVEYRHPSVYTQFYREFRLRFPSGYCLPGATVNNSLTVADTSSRFKIVWSRVRAHAFQAETDCCIPTWTGEDTIAVDGNGLDPKRNGGSQPEGTSITYSWSHQAPAGDNIFGFYVSGTSSVHSPKTAYDAKVETFQFSSDNGVIRNVYNDADYYRLADGTDPLTIGEDTFYLTGWSGNYSATNAFWLFADVYHAVGSNARARIYCHNATTLAASTAVYIVPPDSWSASTITCTPATREALTYMSVILADGTLLQNVVYS